MRGHADCKVFRRNSGNMRTSPSPPVPLRRIREVLAPGRPALAVGVLTARLPRFPLEFSFAICVKRIVLCLLLDHVVIDRGFSLNASVERPIIRNDDLSRYVSTQLD